MQQSGDFAADTVVLRPAGWGATGDDGRATLDKIKRPGHVYRGMEAAEYEATLGAGKPIYSTGAYSHRSEGTSFDGDPATAESYVNFGRSDPRTTGRDTFLVEVRRTASMYVDKDGYTKDRSPVSPENVTRVWRMFAQAGEVVMKLMIGR